MKAGIPRAGTPASEIGPAGVLLPLLLEGHRRVAPPVDAGGPRPEVSASVRLGTATHTRPGDERATHAVHLWLAPRQRSCQRSRGDGRQRRTMRWRAFCPEPGVLPGPRADLPRPLEGGARAAGRRAG